MRTHHKQKRITEEYLRRRAQLFKRLNSQRRVSIYPTVTISYHTYSRDPITGRWRMRVNTRHFRHTADVVEKLNGLHLSINPGQPPMFLVVERDALTKLFREFR